MVIQANIKYYKVNKERAKDTQVMYDLAGLTSTTANRLHQHHRFGVRIDQFAQWENRAGCSNIYVHMNFNGERSENFQGGMRIRTHPRSVQIAGMECGAQCHIGFLESLSLCLHYAYRIIAA